MERYTIEDIELIRRKSGISYEEAVNLLEYHNGNLAKALVDLERNGRINEGKGFEYANHAGPKGKEKAMSILQKLYRIRLVITNKGKTILNVSLLYAIPFTILLPHVSFIALIFVILFGYKIKIDKNSADFGEVNFDKMVKNAAQNVKETFSELTREFSSGSEPQKPASSAHEDDRSYYRPTETASAPFEQTSSSVQTGTTPVIVHCNEDGNVNISKDKDGFGNASIE